ncbi:hypothetical protein IU433_11910 [Nocardia puris]|uniref:Uncharacterized protein n=1 Tax=Nocardia puris TaxID=208602 RepID=A0A366DNP0_9NOCA|nr:hypothetical protein [Nocardia puris]MBF6214171.1 hypothetical protein [Nocardia puris]MBF6365339.1 hypothetical protein [Nocardia puris]MBF6459741.1 hypothetical protein [Nocardia puris]RBO91713.1 hypothetical protein DFR74_104420 [Nocardia puris]
MRRTIMAVTIAALGAGVLSGCFGDDSSGSNSAYCQAVEDLGGITATPNSSGDLVTKSRKVADVAPSDIKADWEAFADAQEQVSKTTSDLDLTNPEQSLQDMQANATAAQEAAEKLGEVAPRLSKHVEDNCGK